MGDRELLELAAKAAGYSTVDWAPSVLGVDIPHVRSEDDWRWTKWNPLTDDSDALRLAVRCDIDIVFDTEFQRTEAHYSRKNEWVAEPWHDDKAAATRRAIVSVAAKIGGDAHAVRGIQVGERTETDY
jgi:hypothetical protein